MNNNRNIIRAIGALMLVASSHQRADATCVITSSDGYNVNIDIQLLQLVPSTFSCTYGYNWNVKLGYHVWFTGASAPGAMYTLQGTVDCSSDALFFSLPLSGGSGTLTTTVNPWRGVADCSTANLGTLGCHSVTIHISGPNISDRYVSCSVTVLPIELVYFEGVPEGHRTGLNWSTATEHDNDYFTIQRSKDGLAFEDVVRVPGAGNSQSTLYYSAVDPTPYNGLSYYRMEQTDYDGEHSYSRVIAVNTDLAENDVYGYPNPNNGDAFDLVGNYAQRSVEILSSTGTSVYSAPLLGPHVQHPPLAKGVYFVKLTDAEGQRTSGFRLVQD